MRCYLLGAGSLGSLAAYYLQRAGVDVIALPRPEEESAWLERQLVFANGRSQQLSLAIERPQRIERLLLATKASQTCDALTPWLPLLADDAELLCLQNGIGQLQGLGLPTAVRRLMLITQSGANREGSQVKVVAENTTFMGDGSASLPDWFDLLSESWPQLEWRDDIWQVRLQKLAINAVINPLTAIHGCRNGELLQAARLPELVSLANEVDGILRVIEPEWPMDTHERAQQVAQLTANNVSSMLADVTAGRPTEIDFINGWLLAEAQKRGLAAPLNTRVVTQLRNRHPP